VTEYRALLDASRRELALYEELVAVYGTLDALLTDERGVAARLEASHRASWLVAALAELEAELRPARAAGDAPANVVAVWATSRAVAARATAANRLLVARATAVRDRLAPRPAPRGYAGGASRGAALDARA